MKRAGLWASFVMMAVVGCTQPMFRLQSDDEEKAREKATDVKTVGSATTLYGGETVRISGVGIVQGLRGTGGDPEPGESRRAAIHMLKQHGVDDADSFLRSTNTAVVFVTAYINPGERKGELLDVQVELSPRDKATSLAGGYLLECDLSEHADSNQLRGGKGSHQAVKGRVIARAEGPVIVGLGDAADREIQRKGRVLSGARCALERNFILHLKKDSQDARTAKAVMDRINERFYGPTRGAMKGMAEAKDNVQVTLRVPQSYRLNWPRYIRVVRQIPLRDASSGRASYERELSQQLIDPAQTLTAAMKLEALGTSSIPELKKGLQDKHPLVRFCSAEALAYLNDPACAAPLADLIKTEPRFRAHGLTALASYDEGVCHERLAELMTAASPETRYGAFRALRTLDEHDAALNGKFVNENFYLHKVAAGSAAMVHVSTMRRPEVVLFGDEPHFVTPLTLQAGPDFLVTAKDGDDQCIVSRLSPKLGVKKEACSLKVEDVIHKLGQLGATYPDIVDLLQAAARYRSVDCRVAVDALPQSPSIYALALGGARDKAILNAEQEDESTVDFGLTPNLFAAFGNRKPAKSSNRGGGDGLD